MPSLDINTEVDVFNKYYTENLKILEAASEYFRTLINSILLDEVEVQAALARVKYRDECISKFRLKYQKNLEDNNTAYAI